MPVGRRDLVERRDDSESVRKPCATVVPKGPVAAAAGSNGYPAGPRSRPRTRRCAAGHLEPAARAEATPASLTPAAPSARPRRPGVAGTGGEQQHEVAVGDLARARSRGRARAAGRRRSCGRCRPGRQRGQIHAEASGGARTSSASCGCRRASHVGERQTRALERASAARTKFGSDSSRPSFIAAGRRRRVSVASRRGRHCRLTAP